MKISVDFDAPGFDPGGADTAPNGNDHEGAKAHCEAAAWHAAAHELHLLAARGHVEGDHELARYYARLVSGESNRAHELSCRALAISTATAVTEDEG